MSDERAPRFAVPEDFTVDGERILAMKKRLVEEGVRACFATFVDVYGIPKSKATPIESFEHMCEGSELYTVGAVEGLGLVGPQEDECAAVPDLDTLTILPWDRSRAWFHSDLYYHGKPYRGDPRVLLRRARKRALDMGFRFNLGIEPELFVLREGDDGALQPITRTRFKGPNACYDLALATGFGTTTNHRVGSSARPGPMRRALSRCEPV